MNYNVRKLALFLVSSLLLVTSSVAPAMASNSAYSYFSKPNTISHLANFADETDKVITNVKVFYNPIAEQVLITFKLSQQQNVSIKVMDALGSEVLNLMNGRLDAGSQNLSFEANGKLTSGFYFVRVTSGSETVVKRVSVK